MSSCNPFEDREIYIGDFRGRKYKIMALPEIRDVKIAVIDLSQIFYFTLIFLAAAFVTVR